MYLFLLFIFNFICVLYFLYRYFRLNKAAENPLPETPLVTIDKEQIRSIMCLASFFNASWKDITIYVEIIQDNEILDCYELPLNGGEMKTSPFSKGLILRLRYRENTTIINFEETGLIYHYIITSNHEVLPIIKLNDGEDFMDHVPPHTFSKIITNHIKYHISIGRDITYEEQMQMIDDAANNLVDDTLVKARYNEVVAYGLAENKTAPIRLSFIEKDGTLTKAYPCVDAKMTLEKNQEI